MSFHERLEQAIAAVCPIPVGSSVSIGKRADRSTWRFQTLASATEQQILAGRAVIDAFDDSDAAQAAWEEDKQPERKTLRQQAANALAEIDAFLAIANPTAAQVRDEVRRIVQRQKAIIRRLIQID